MQRWSVRRLLILPYICPFRIPYYPQAFSLSTQPCHHPTKDRDLSPAPSDHSSNTQDLIKAPVTPRGLLGSPSCHSRRLVQVKGLYTPDG